MEGKPVQLMWTGGWDSTFQLLRLLLVHGCPVEPVYLIDEGRGSLAVELKTMEHLRALLAERYPHTRTMLRPTLFAKVSDLQPDTEIEHAYQRVVRTHPIGTQYGWMARFCRQRGFSNVEIGAEYTYHGAGALLTDRFAEATSWSGYTTYKLPETEDPDLRLLFGHYNFPLARTTKFQMRREAELRNWMPLMTETWFCHSPVNMKPCGTCNPCQSAITEGFGWRIPRSRRLVAGLHRATVGPVKKTAKRIVQKFRGTYLTPPSATQS